VNFNTVYIAADNIISSLGFTSEENFNNCKNGNSGITYIEDKDLSQIPFYASLVNRERLLEKFEKIADNHSYTKTEKLFILSITEVLKELPLPLQDPSVQLILSTTKGNIDLLEKENYGNFNKDRLELWETAGIINKHFGFVNEPLVVSHACVSGLTAIILAYRMIKTARYKTVVVSGADILSEFVISGFQSFKAISSLPCKPFDVSRNGISLGEGCGTIVLTSDTALMKGNETIRVLGGSTSNDANHISGPSRTGDGLFYAIDSTMKEAGITDTASIDFISAHGTATTFNDEMEAKAFNLAGLADIPVNSLKGFFGHTLGAAGIIESVISLYSLKNNILIPTRGFEQAGVSEKINLIANTTEKNINSCLKTASGFGGCNAAVIYYKE